MKTYFVSGHLDITDTEFQKHYIPILEEAISSGARFVVGDARGCDLKTQQHLMSRGVRDVVVYHMMTSPRNNVGFPTRGGFENDEARDAAMTEDSDADTAWVRPGRESSGTAKNLKRRTEN